MLLIPQSPVTARLGRVSNNNPETQNSPAPGGLPLRGLAMVLIAVAVLLGLWALYSLTQDGEDPTRTADSANTSDSAPAIPGTPGGSPDAATPPAPAESPAPGAPDDAAGNEEEPPAAEEAEGEATRPGEERAAGESAERDRGEAAPGGSGKPAAEPKLNVLNNSTVPQLAATVSEQLNEEGFTLGEVGNFSDEIFPETTVFFQPGNTAAEQEARELASRLGGVAREYKDTLPEETRGKNDLTLVLVKEVIL